MKRSWGWKGAVIGFVVWVAYVFGMRALEEIGERQYGPMRRVQPLSTVVERAHRGLAAPGEVLINAAWRFAGRAVYPRISHGISGQPAPDLLEDENFRWALYPMVCFEDSTSVMETCLYIYWKPERLAFALHLIGLPGAAMAGMGSIFGLILSFVARIVGAKDAGPAPSATKAW